MIVSIIVAAAQNGVIGSDNRLPWQLPDDLKRFKALSLGKPVVMGRKTFESIGRRLPGRMNIVVSRRPDLQIEGVTVVRSIDQALAAAGAAPEVVMIGGAEIFREVLPRTHIIHLTRVHASVSGDVFLPPLAPQAWREVAMEHHPADERHQYAFSFVTLQRVES